MIRTTLIKVCLLACAVAAFPARAQVPEFSVWLEELRAEAIAAGISEATVDAALAGVVPIERVTELDRNQPEFTITFWDYLDRVENSQGAGHSYPTDGAGRAWNHPDFDPATSTIGPWGAIVLPAQGGIIDAFPPATPASSRAILSRCASPPDRVGAGWPRRRYPSPTC